MLVLVLLLGLLMGILLEHRRLRPVPPMALVDDVSVAAVPVVTIHGIRNGVLVGSMSGTVRLVAGGKPVLPGAEGGFTVSDSKLLTNVIEVTVPPGMQFVASKRGKKYYSVHSADGQRIVPQNRVYFPDEASAKKAGFVR